MTTKGQSRTPSLGEVIRAAMDTRIADLHVALPGKVEKYDAATQKADVKPLIMRRVATAGGDELIESIPVITDVPVIFPRSKEFFISLPIAKGDHVLLVFVERSIDAFVSSQPGTETDPDDFRTHDLSDAVAYAGFWPGTAALKEADASNLVLGKDDGGIQVHLTPGGKVEVKLGGGTAGLSAAIAEKLETLYTQAVTGIKAVYEAHTHGSGMGPTGPPLPPANVMPTWDAAIASAKLKVED